MKHKYWGIAIVTALGFIACQSGNDNFLITNDSIGTLTKSTPFSEIATVYANDSIVQDSSVSIAGTASAKKANIYEKGGAHLLTLTPSEDSIPTVENIRIYDPRFKTEKGVGLNSTFKDIKDKYTIRKIITSMNNVVIFIKENDLYFTIDKKELPSSLRYASSTNIEAVQIPDTAKIKYLMIGWE